MRLNQLADVLASNREFPLHFILPSGEIVPEHFHVTEVGRVQKTFVDCGGTRRESVTCLLQVWTAHDVDHRLGAEKLSKILKLSESVLGSDDLEVEVEYGVDVASQYKLIDAVAKSEGVFLVLDGKRTECLAEDKCGVSLCGTPGCC